MSTNAVSVRTPFDGRTLLLGLLDWRQVHRFSIPDPFVDGFSIFSSQRFHDLFDVLDVFIHSSWAES